MKIKILFAFGLTASLIPLAVSAEETSPWSCDFSLYGLAAGMSGNATVKGVNANVDVGFDKILDHLQFGAMGTARIGYDRWALTTDIIYMKLGASKNAVNVDLEQWVVEPTLSYRLCKYFEPLVGLRYNNVSGDINGPFGRNPTGTQEWYDPIIGGNVNLPLSQSFSFNLRGDIGGFGVGSDLTWQAFPNFEWHFSKSASVQLGYRLLYNDYETGSGLNKFKYDILTSGPQIGFAYHF
jgi:hypothetical protein